MGENPNNFYNDNIKYANPPAGGCNWDLDYYRTNYINAIMLGQLKKGNYIESGLVPSQGTGLNIDVTAGVAVIGGTKFAIDAFSQAVNLAPIGGVEFNLVYIDYLGQVQVVNGDPEIPGAALAIVDTNDTAIIRFMDATQYGKEYGQVAFDTVKTADFNILSNISYVVDTSGGSVTATLPAGPAADDVFVIKDYANSFDEFPMLFDLNGHLVDGKDELILDTKGFGGYFIYVDATIGWALILTAKESLLSGRNALINGGFDMWQRGTTQTNSGFGSDDRWLNSNVGSSKTHWRQTFDVGQTDVPGNPRYFSRTVVASGNTASSYTLKGQRIEGVRTLSGGQCVFSFYAKADTAKDIAIEFRQSFGTGGTPSADVSLTLAVVSLSTEWTKYEVPVTLPSIADKILGTNENDYLMVYFWFDAGTTFDDRTGGLGNQSGTFDIANVQLELGTEGTPFELKTVGQVLRECQRYCHVLVPEGGAFGPFAMITKYGTSVMMGHITMPQEMRVAPTLGVSSSSHFRIIDAHSGVFTSMDVYTSGSTKLHVGISVNASSLPSTGSITSALCFADGNAYIIFDAEL